jgi:hypothetical protein
MAEPARMTDDADLAAEATQPWGGKQPTLKSEPPVMSE